MQNLSLKTISTSRIKKYLAYKGYLVSVNKVVKPTNEYREAYSILFAQGQQVPQPILDQFLLEFSLISDRNTATRLLLPPEVLVWLLPLFPRNESAFYKDEINEEIIRSEKINEVVKNEIENTKNSDIADTSIIEIIQKRNLQQIKEDNQKIDKLYHNPYYSSQHMTVEERYLFEKYIEEEFYDRSRAFRYKEGATRFFLSDEIAKKMYEIAYLHGFPKNGKIFIPACHVGSLVKPALNINNILGFEENLYALNIAYMFYPKLPLYNLRFEQAFFEPSFYSTLCSKQDAGKITWLKEYPFDLVMTNPVIGQVYNKFQRQLHWSMPNEESRDWVYNELYYLYYGVLMLKPNGLLVIATSTKFMDDNTDLYYQRCKKELFKIAKLEQSYRLPSYHFELTEEDCDLLVFRRL